MHSLARRRLYKPGRAVTAESAGSMLLICGVVRPERWRTACPPMGGGSLLQPFRRKSTPSWTRHCPQKWIHTDCRSLNAVLKSVFTDSRSLNAVLKSVLTDSRSVFTDSRSVFTDSRSVFTDSRSVFTDSGSLNAVLKSVFTDSRRQLKREREVRAASIRPHRDLGNMRAAFNMNNNSDVT
jgi:hypothetical protein